MAESKVLCIFRRRKEKLQGKAVGECLDEGGRDGAEFIRNGRKYVFGGLNFNLEKS